MGFVDWQDDCYNAAAVLADGRVQAVYHKRFLPNYGVFDEARYFQAGGEQLVIEVQGARVGIVICEDIWYSAPVAGDLAVARLDLICCISASPYHRGKGLARERMLATRAADCAAALAFCNLVGGQDELVFDGHSAVFDGSGEVVARCDQLTEDFAIAEIEVGAAARRRLREPLRPAHQRGSRPDGAPDRTAGVCPRPQTCRSTSSRRSRIHSRSCGGRWCWACAIISERTVLPGR